MLCLALYGYGSLDSNQNIQDFNLMCQLEAGLTFMAFGPLENQSNLLVVGKISPGRFDLLHRTHLVPHNQYQ
jgi:hypothetical protein